MRSACLQFFVGPCGSDFLRDQPFHRPAKVRVYDKLIAGVSTRPGVDRDGFPSLEFNSIHFLIKEDFHSSFTGQICHPLAYRGTTSYGVIDPMFIFKEGKDGKKTRAIERRHTQVFRLERERKPDPGIGEIARKFGIEGFPWP